MTTTTQGIQVPALASAPPAPVQLVQWQDVPTSQLEPYAPDPSLPMGRYAVMTVMAYAQAQGYAGAIPTWEVGSGASGPTWGVILISSHADLSQVSIPIADLPGFDPSNVAGWGQGVMRWAAAQGYQMAIPTFDTDGTSVTALAFAPGYPGLTFYDAPNTQLFQSLAQARMVANLQDPAVWANAAMRVAMSLGYAAGWPTWEWTTSRGLWGMSAYDYGALPEASGANVQNVLTILNRTLSTVQTSTDAALADFAGIYDTFDAAPVSDPGLQILTDCLFGAAEAGLNLIPVVGGALGSLLGTAVQVAQDAANGKSGGGPTTLETYQSMLSAASDATATYVSQLHDTLMDAQGNGTLQQVWAQVYDNPLGGPPIQLGMLANAPNDVVNGDVYWTSAGQQLTSSLNLNLQASITGQLYVIQRRTYQNAPPGKQWWYGSISEVTSPTGPMAQYIASADDELSVWFTDYVQEPGHARGEYVTSTEFWLQSAESSGLPTYPPPALCYALFNGDGFGNTQGYTGAFSKSTVYNNWLMATDEVGQDGAYVQAWSYASGGNIVTATITNPNAQTANSAWTDAYGNVTLNTSNPVVQNADEVCGFQQQVITNSLSPLN